MKFFADLSVECGKTITYVCFASYHGSGIWDGHLAHNKKAIRNFLIHIEGLRQKRLSKNFNPLAELSQLAHTLLNALDHTVVYPIYNIERDASLKPHVKPVKGISKFHYFHFVDGNQVDCSIMSGHVFPCHSIQFQLASSSSSSHYCNHDDIDDEQEEEEEQDKPSNIDDLLYNDMEWNLSDDDDYEDDIVSNPAPPLPKRHRVTRSTHSSIYSDYIDIDDIDLG
jgi:hypothetical protein